MTDPMPIDAEAPERKVDGRTKEGRALRAAGIQRARQTRARGNVRDQVREPMREARGGNVVIGHNGEQLSRKRKSTGDMFEIPKELIPKGWEYQWCAVSIVGNSEILMDQNLMFQENGWRSVPSERHDGRFMPVGHKGHIIRGGQMLMERPKALCDEARAEDIALARRQIQDRDQSLMGGKANVRNLPSGFEMGGKYRGTGGSLKMSIDPGIDVPMPHHQVAGSDE